MNRNILVVPCYNEASRLRVEAFLDFLNQSSDISIIFVNDGSKDQTESVLKGLVSRSQSKAEVLSLASNVGKAEAIRRGFLKAFSLGASRVGYWDADLATPLTAAPELFSVLESRPDLEIVLGSRVKLLGHDIERTYVRHYLGRVFATGASVVLVLAVYDTQCGAKVFKNTPEIRKLFENSFLSRWIFDVEILAKYLFVTLPADRVNRAKAIYELPLREWKDVPGSKLKWTDFFVAAFELIKIARRYPLWRDI